MNKSTTLIALTTSLLLACGSQSQLEKTPDQPAGSTSRNSPVTVSPEAEGKTLSPVTAAKHPVSESAITLQHADNKVQPSKMVQPSVPVIEGGQRENYATTDSIRPRMSGWNR